MGGSRSAVKVQGRKCLKRAGFQSGHVAEASDLHFHTTSLCGQTTPLPWVYEKAEYVCFRKYLG